MARCPGPSGFWCRFCGKYQSTRTTAEVKKAKAHHGACAAGLPGGNSG
jgi:hypothetical protein